MMIGLEELQKLLGRILMGRGVPAPQAALLAATIAFGERDGTKSHGLNRLQGYLDSIACGWVNPAPSPVIEDIAPGLLKVDGDNGFAQVALALARDAIVSKARSAGVACLAIANSHHFAALWPDIEPFAHDGFIALTMVNSRSRIIVWDGARKALGTNPIAFACPRQGKPPIVWDQASSIMSQGDVLLHAAAGRPLPSGMAVDGLGKPTTDPKLVLESGALLPVGGVKGSSLAFMVEVLAAAFTGGRFGFEDQSGGFPGAQTSNAGQFVLLIDPARMAGSAFFPRIESLIAELYAAGAKRLPSDRRYRQRAQSERDGIEISAEFDALLRTGI
jgi:delta1-piperideine-2-carboxylate reductase